MCVSVSRVAWSFHSVARVARSFHPRRPSSRATFGNRESVLGPETRGRFLTCWYQVLVGRTKKAANFGPIMSFLNSSEGENFEKLGKPKSMGSLVSLTSVLFGTFCSYIECDAPELAVGFLCAALLFALCAAVG